MGPVQANHPRLWRNILTTLKTVSETASELGKEAKESIDELVRSAGKKLDDARDDTGDALHAAASSVRTTGRQGSEAIDNLATGAADRLDATASYIEDHDLKDVYTGLRRFARRHLTGSLVAAVAIGFLAGSALSRVTHSCGKAPEGS
jgi:ABC-type transporter Mla subunit MlaD